VPELAANVASVWGSAAVEHDAEEAVDDELDSQCLGARAWHGV
jgi:hypothetical protein